MEAILAGLTDEQRVIAEAALQAEKDKTRAAELALAKTTGQLEATAAMKGKASERKDPAGVFIPVARPQWKFNESDEMIQDPKYPDDPTKKVPRKVDDTTWEKRMDYNAAVIVYTGSDFSVPSDSLRMTSCFGLGPPLTLCCNTVAMGGTIYPGLNTTFWGTAQKYSEDLANHAAWMDKDLFLSFEDWDSAQLLFRRVLIANSANGDTTIAKLYAMHTDWIRARKTAKLWPLYARYDREVRKRLNESLAIREFPHSLGPFQPAIFQACRLKFGIGAADMEPKADTGPWSRIVALSNDEFRNKMPELEQGLWDIVHGKEYHPPAPSFLCAKGTVLRASWANSNLHQHSGDSDASSSDQRNYASLPSTTYAPASSNTGSSKKNRTQGQQQQQSQQQQKPQQQGGQAQQSQANNLNQRPFRADICVGCGQKHADGRKNNDCPTPYPSLERHTGMGASGTQWACLKFAKGDGEGTIPCRQWNVGACGGNPFGGGCNASGLSRRDRVVSSSTPRTNVTTGSNSVFISDSDNLYFAATQHLIPLDIQHCQPVPSLPVRPISAPSSSLDVQHRPAGLPFPSPFTVQHSLPSPPALAPPSLPRLHPSLPFRPPPQRFSPLPPKPCEMTPPPATLATPTPTLLAALSRYPDSARMEVEAAKYQNATTFVYAAWDKAISMLLGSGTLSVAEGERYAKIPDQVRFGSDLGITGTVERTFLPRNHVDMEDADAVRIVRDDIAKEISLGRMAGPFEKDLVIEVLGPVRSAPIGVVEKALQPGKEQAYRIIENLSFGDDENESLNAGLNPDDFECRWPNRENLKSFFRTLPPSAAAMGIDAQDGFKHVGVHPKVRAHVVVWWEEKVYIRMVASFGARTTPAIFCNFVDATLDATTMILRNRIKASNEMDDFLFVRFRDDVTEEEVLALTRELGWQIHPTKGFSWSRIFVYAGIIWNLNDLTMTIPEGKRLKYLAAVLESLKKYDELQKFSLKQVQSLVGYLQYATMVIPSMRSQLHHFYAFQRDYGPNPRRQLKLPHPASRALRRWQTFLEKPAITGSFAIPPSTSDLQIASDASDTGLGIVVGDFAVCFQLELGWRKKFNADIGAAESWGVEAALEYAIRLGAEDCRLTMLCDNMGFIGAWGKGWTRNKLMNRTVTRMTQMAGVYGIIIKLVYVASADNVADAFSRGVGDGKKPFPFEPPIPRGVVGGLPP